MPTNLIPASALPVLIAALLMVIAFSITWLVQLRTKNAGIVDAIWPWSLGATGAIYAIVGFGDPMARGVMGILALLWGLRLGCYLWQRNHGSPEDGRYARFRESWGDRAAWNMYWFFQFQVLMALLLSVGFWVIAVRESPAATWALILAVAIWLVSVIGELIAAIDHGLAAHAYVWSTINRSAGCGVEAGLCRLHREHECANSMAA